ncbi:hypothetical protein KWAN_81 [Erwinia phage vB_EamM_Kwan]|uniref:Lipoprotein n=1 Tax=Erwinia phage vB_EamM_Kwan TaxID=1883374 RepID=A0A1B2IDU9_9CAUD|nr:hypothetical protein BIZ80_gp218 [Erwinia phage vB_EamM_Kwan]ANZ49433.1 hypothetical protein KWAN_81 [Erwinia phage vB_EamM_Kwan]
MLTRNHLKAIAGIVLFVAAACSIITVNNDYNHCVDLGNSAAQCTGRG